MHRNQRRRQKKARAGWIMIATAMPVLILLLAAGTLLPTPVKLDPATLCPLDHTVKAQVALLIDRTDPLDAAQQRRLSEAIDRVKASLPVGGKLTVHLLTADPLAAATPEISLCNPGDGHSLNPFDGNPRRARRRFETGFVGPIDRFTAALAGGASAAHSPILEAIATVAGTLTRGVPDRIVVVSDLLQNSPMASFYRRRPDATAALNTPEGRVLQDGRLAGVDVDLVLLQNPTQLARQDAHLTAFWTAVLSAAGARPTLSAY